MKMTPRERMLTILSHKEPDRVPLTAKLWLDTRIRLRQYYGVGTDEELYEKLGVDNSVVTVYRGMPEGWRPTAEYLAFCESTGYTPEVEYANFEEWGIRRKLGVKGKSILQQYFFTHHPWEGFTTPKQVLDVELPDLDDSRFKAAEVAIEEKRDSYMILGGIGHVLWTKGWELRGMLRFMKDLHTNPEMAEAILDKLLDYGCRLADKFLDIGCDGISISEDWGNNHSLFISPVLWRKYFKPRYKRLFDRAKRRGKLVYFHSDGNITPIVGDLVEIGIDILNPVQPECMNQVEIKRKYGDKITIDTGVSNQKTLPFGTPEDVKREVLYALKNLAPGGGFIYGTSHYAMYDVPIENIVMLYETCRKYGNYPIRITE
jgi:uroporphyrinogen decarboxylase